MNVESLKETILFTSKVANGVEKDLLLKSILHVFGRCFSMHAKFGTSALQSTLTKKLIEFTNEHSHIARLHSKLVSYYSPKEGWFM